MTTFVPSTDSGKWIGYQILVGTGRGLALQMVCWALPFFLGGGSVQITNLQYNAQPIVALQEGLPKEEFAIGTASVTVCQYLGGSVSVSIAQTIFRNKLAPALAIDAPSVDPQAIMDAGAYELAKVVPPDALVGVIRAYNDALSQTFVSCTLQRRSPLPFSLVIQGKRD